MKNRILFLVVMILILSSSLSSAGNKTFDMNKLVVNDETYEYVAQKNLLLNSDYDRIKTLFTKMAEALNASITWNEADKTIQVIKPNVQMMTATNVGKDSNNNTVIVGPFGKVKKGDKLKSFFVFTELQNLPSSNIQVRLVVEAPGQSKLDDDEFVTYPDVATIKSTDSWINFEVKNANFSKAGAYKLLLQMKIDGEETFVTIAKREIYSN